VFSPVISSPFKTLFSKRGENSLSMNQRESQLAIPNPQTSPRSSADAGTDIAHLFQVVMRFKWGILGLAFAITLITSLIVFSMQPVYRASATIVLESQEANVVNVEEVYSLDTRNYSYTQTQFEILQSRSLAERVVRKLQLHNNPAFYSKEESEKSWYRKSDQMGNPSHQGKWEVGSKRRQTVCLSSTRYGRITYFSTKGRTVGLAQTSVANSGNPAHSGRTPNRTAGLPGGTFSI